MKSSNGLFVVLLLLLPLTGSTDILFCPDGTPATLEPIEDNRFRYHCPEAVVEADPEIEENAEPDSPFDPCGNPFNRDLCCATTSRPDLYNCPHFACSSTGVYSTPEKTCAVSCVSSTKPDEEIEFPCSSTLDICLRAAGIQFEGDVALNADPYVAIIYGEGISAAAACRAALTIPADNPPLPGKDR